MSKKPNTSRWTVAKYLNDIYIPSRAEQRGLSLRDRTADWYRHVVRKVDALVGHPVKLREVTPELIERIEKLMAKENCGDSVARRYVEILRAIVRHWKPDAFPISTIRGNPDLTFLNSDMPETLEHVFIHHYLPVRTKITSQATIHSYGKAIRRFSEFLGHTATLADLSDETTGRFLRWLVEVKGVKAVSANGEFKTIKALWNWCARKRMVERFPTIEQLPEPEVVPSAWTYDELQSLLRACREVRGLIGPVPASDYWLAFHFVLWDTGERTGAMLELRWDMIDWKAGHMVVPAEVRKGGRKAMVYHLKQATRNVLERIRQPKRALIFGHGIDACKQFFYDRYRALIESAGLTYVSHKTGPQKMRRSFASHLEARGGNATKALKHTSRLVTEESYLDPRISEPESQNVKLPDLAGLSRKGGEA